MPRNSHDFIAIGLGPFNLGLACLADPIDTLDAHVIEASNRFEWHPHMLLDDTTLQNPYLADLVSLADPCSRFSFLNYCKQNGSLYAHYIREKLYLDRAEYNRYCQWAASRLDTVSYGSTVTEIDYDAARACYHVRGNQTSTGLTFSRTAPRLVIGIGSMPRWPSCCEPLRKHCTHSADYLRRKATLQHRRSIAVIGSGQSAAEVFADLLADCDRYGYTLSWITRTPRLFPMESTRFTLEMASPDYLDYLHTLDANERRRAVADHTTLYKGVNANLLNRIYDMLDRRRQSGAPAVHIVGSSELVDCDFDPVEQAFSLHFKQRALGRSFVHRVEDAVFATGYTQRAPAFLDGVHDRIQWDEDGQYRVARNYAIDIHGGEIFVQNGATHTHGLASPDLGLGCYRNASILRSITGVEHYAVEQRIALQHFGIPEGVASFSQGHDA